MSRKKYRPQQPDHISLTTDHRPTSLLAYLEALGQELPRVNGVPVCQALTYELIQIVNQIEAQNDTH